LSTLASRLRRRVRWILSPSVVGQKTATRPFGISEAMVYSLAKAARERDFAQSASAGLGSRGEGAEGLGDGGDGGVGVEVADNRKLDRAVGELGRQPGADLIEIARERTSWAGRPKRGSPLARRLPTSVASGPLAVWRSRGRLLDALARWRSASGRKPESVTLRPDLELQHRSSRRVPPGKDKCVGLGAEGEAHRFAGEDAAEVVDAIAEAAASKVAPARALRPRWPTGSVMVPLPTRALRRMTQPRNRSS